jgi:hypothetical protein
LRLEQRPIAKRLLWFVLLWAGGVAAVAGVAWLIKLWLGAA